MYNTKQFGLLYRPKTHVTFFSYPKYCIVIIVIHYYAYTHYAPAEYFIVPCGMSGEKLSECDVGI